MEVHHQQNGLKDIFSNRYHQNVLSKSLVADKDITLDDASKYDLNIPQPKDVFVLSDDYLHMISIRDKIIGGFKDTSSFLAMAKTLKDENIINNNDMIAIDFLAKESPKLDFEVFKNISKNDQLSLEMRDLIREVTQKLEMINEVNEDAMLIKDF